MNRNMIGRALALALAVTTTLTTTLTASLAAAAPPATISATTSAATAAGASAGRPAAIVTAAAPGRPRRVFEQHPFPTHEHGIDHPAGAALLDGTGTVAVAGRDGDRVTLLELRSDTVVGRMQLTRTVEAATLADDGNGELAALSGRSLLTWPASARGTVAPRVLHVAGPPVRDPRGMTYDPAADRWLVLDGDRLVSLSVRHGAVQAWRGAALSGTSVPTAGALRGLALDPAGGRLYVGDTSSSSLLVVDRDGRQSAVLDAADVGLGSLSALAFGATADPTDSSANTTLFAVVEGGGSTLGRVAEVSLTPLGTAAAAAATTSTASLVKASALSTLSPPSPDPAGIVYMSDLDRLFVADSEVDEMTIYQSVNLWQISRNRSTLFDAGNTLKYSKEPTGIGYDPQRRRAFVSDDDKKRIFQVTVGPDNRFGTSDDPVTSISTSAFGDTDPEDVTYDTVSGDLFVTDGVGLEVWRVDGGRNGIFDGVAPTGDDVVTHFDVSGYGITDLEGIGYSPTRDSLFLADRKYTKVVEVTSSGALVQSIDVAAIGMKNPASITLAPATNDPTRTSMYVVTRGIDNDNHPTENDGMMYELAAPNLGPTSTATNAAPTVSAGADQRVRLPAAALLEGTAVDDGRPNPPGFLTTTWSKVSGPGTVSFDDAGAQDTRATFGAAGTYVLRLSATDSALTTTDDVTVVVDPASVTNTAPSVSVGPDQDVTLPASASLHALVSDDGLPNPPGATTVLWSQVGGPGDVTFSAPSSATTNAAFTAAGTYTLRVTASDGALADSDDVVVTVSPAPPSGNLVANGGFESDLTGWKGSGGTLTRVADPHTGGWSGRLANTATTASTCQLNDSPNWVAQTGPALYTATAWVKGDASSVGATVRLRFREYVGQTAAGSAEAAVTLTTGWQQVVLTYRPSSPGSTLDLNLLRASTPAGATCFTADDISATSS